MTEVGIELLGQLKRKTIWFPESENFFWADSNNIYFFLFIIDSFNLTEDNVVFLIKGQVPTFVKALFGLVVDKIAQVEMINCVWKGFHKLGELFPLRLASGGFQPLDKMLFSRVWGEKISPAIGVAKQPPSIRDRVKRFTLHPEKSTHTPQLLEQSRHQHYHHFVPEQSVSRCYSLGTSQHTWPDFTMYNHPCRCHCHPPLILPSPSS